MARDGLGRSKMKILSWRQKGKPTTVHMFFFDECADYVEPRWNHSLVTGDEYLTEYRCLSKEGQWRWMLGRALPMRDGNGKIVKWYVPHQFTGATSMI